jgi:hypothetical protein
MGVNMTFDAAVLKSVGTSRVEWVEDPGMEMRGHINDIANDKYRRVRENDLLKTTGGILTSPGYTRCHALCFLDDGSLAPSTGVIGHMNCNTTPQDLMNGKVTGHMTKHDADNVNEIYRNPEKVSVLHVFGKDENFKGNSFFEYNTPDYWKSINGGSPMPEKNPFENEEVERVLGKYGFRNVSHIPMFPDGGYDLDGTISRSIALDREKGVLYVVPYSFVKDPKGYFKISFF